MHGFDFLGPRLAERGMQRVAIDLRGRGLSQTTPPGSYGIASHARDVVHCAQALGAERFAVLGWSLGALIGMQLAATGTGAVLHLVLFDDAGRAGRSACLAAS